MSAAELVAQLAAVGTPPELLAAVAKELFTAEVSLAALEARRSNERARKAGQRHGKSREVTGQGVTKRDRRGQPPEVSPKDINQTPSSPPVEVSEPDGSSPQQRPWALPVGVNLQTWTDFLTNRKKKRLVNTASTWKAFQDDLSRVSVQTGIPPPKLIAQCTGKGWGGIYDPTEDQDHGRTNGMARHQSSDGLSPTTRAARSVFG